MRIIRPAAFLFSVMLLVGCVSVPTKAPPIAKLVYGGGFTQHVIEVFPESIVDEAFDTNSDKVVSRKKISLAPGEAEKIVSALLAQGVGDWLTDYGSSDGMIPGAEPGTTIERGHVDVWRLSIQQGGRSIVSSGKGMYPSDVDPKKAVEMESSQRYERMVAVFHAAVGQ